MYSSRWDRYPFPILVASLLMLPLFVKSADAQATTIVHSFYSGDYNDGANPYSALILGANGNLYGTASNYGSGNFGMVYQYDISSGVESPVYGFDYEINYDGSAPYAPLLLGSDGNYYGTTFYGGINTEGTLFQYNPTTGKENQLYSFGYVNYGGNPSTGLIEGADHNFLYGVAYAGGIYGYGEIYEYNLALHTISLVWSFGGPGDGWGPAGALIQDQFGNLYGTTERGGANGVGTVYKFNTATSTETILHSFGSSATDGTYPTGALLLASDGNFYGTTYEGGAEVTDFYGDGTIFQYNPNASTEAIVYSFGKNGTLLNGVGPYVSDDGQNPNGPLIQATDGNLYGTTSNGGWGLGGTLFEYNMTTSEESVLHAFSDGTVANDGKVPNTSVLQGPDGNLYGTTQRGGGLSQYGTIFEYNPTGPANPVVPTTSIASLSISSCAAGSPTFPLVISGSGFVPTTKVFFGSTQLKPFYGNTQTLEVHVPAALVTAAGPVTIDVYNPTAPASKTAFDVYPASNTPTLTGFSVPNVVVGTTPDITVNGLNFEPGGAVIVDGESCQTQWITSDTVSFQMPASKTAKYHVLSVSFENPAPSGGTSNTLPLPEFDTPPTTYAELVGDQIGSLYVGPTTVYLEVAKGTGAVANTYYNLDGTGVQTYTTPFVVSTAGPHTLQYWSEDVYDLSEKSNTLTFNIGQLTLTNLSPNNAPVGPQPTIILTGTNFVDGCTVLVNGQSYSAFRSNSSTISFTMPLSKMNKTHVLELQVQNPEGDTSNELPFTVN